MLVLSSIAQALRRLNDPKALPALAHLAITFRDDRTQLQTWNESIIAFGAITGLYKVPAYFPTFENAHNIDPRLNQAAMPLIEQWLKDHPEEKPTSQPK